MVHGLMVQSKSPAAQLNYHVWYNQHQDVTLLFSMHCTQGLEKDRKSFGPASFWTALLILKQKTGALVNGGVAEVFLKCAYFGVNIFIYSFVFRNWLYLGRIKWHKLACRTQPNSAATVFQQDSDPISIPTKEMSNQHIQGNVRVGVKKYTWTETHQHDEKALYCLRTQIKPKRTKGTWHETQDFKYCIISNA